MSGSSVWALTGKEYCLCMDSGICPKLQPLSTCPHRKAETLATRSTEEASLGVQIMPWSPALGDRTMQGGAKGRRGTLVFHPWGLAAPERS